MKEDKVFLGEASFSKKEGSVGSIPTPGFLEYPVFANCIYGFRNCGLIYRLFAFSKEFGSVMIAYVFEACFY